MSNTEVRVGKLPKCIFCVQLGMKTNAEYDGATKSGPWAFMCERHFGQHGVGLGELTGKKFVLVRM